MKTLGIDSMQVKLYLRWASNNMQLYYNRCKTGVTDFLSFVNWTISQTHNDNLRDILNDYI